MIHVPRLPRDDVNVPREHPLVEASWLIAAIGVAMLALVAAAAIAGEALARWLPLDTEIRWLGAGALEPSGEDPRDTALQALVDRLVTHEPDPALRPSARLVEDAAPNALALPGGRILVTSALAEAAESENEVAFVLAHELGHLVHRDALRRLGRTALVLVLLSIALGGGGTGDAGLPAGVANLASRGFDRAQEGAADLHALELVQAEYGHVAGATRFFERLPDARANAGDRMAAWLVTHPVTQDRIEALRRIAGERGFPTDGALVPWAPGAKRGGE